MSRFLVLAAILLVACGSETTSNPDGSVDMKTNPPSCDVFSSACMACATQLTSDSAACAVDPQACTAMQNVDVAAACFTTEGACQKAALFQAADCHRACCDVEQANVEVCTADCFVTRSECQVAALRAYDLCYMQCNDAVTCGLCDADFFGASDGCGAAAQRCADTCVRTHRKS